MERKSPDSHTSANVMRQNDILLAVIPPIGFRSEWGAVLGYLKIAGGKTLEIETSEVEFLDARGKVVETYTDAFGLATGARITGPYSERFADDSRRNENASIIRWRVNDMEVETGLAEPEGIELRVVYLPLLVAIKHDPHIVVTVVNRTDKMLDISEGVRNAACLADGNRYQSITGGHWDGEYQIRPGFSAMYQFSLSDFPGLPNTGSREMSFQILGLKSQTEVVDWNNHKVSPNSGRRSSGCGPNC